MWKFSVIFAYKKPSVSGKKIRPNDNLKKKKICRIFDFAFPEDHTENQKNAYRERQVLGLWLRSKKAVEHEGDDDTSWNYCGLQKLEKLARRFKNRRRNRDYPNDGIVEISQDT